MIISRGTLKTWNPHKGYGFIAPEDGGDDVFLHIRDVGHTSRPPRVGDVIRYQTMATGDGRMRAGDIQIEGVPRQLVSQTTSYKAMQKKTWLSWQSVISIVLVAGLGSASFFHYPKPERGPALEQSTPASISSSGEGSQYRCEGKQHCSEMSSCDEAWFYLHNCPNTKLDGDRDGVPCEKQWCGQW